MLVSQATRGRRTAKGAAVKYTPTEVVGYRGIVPNSALFNMFMRWLLRAD